MSRPSSLTVRAATAADAPALGRLGALLVETHHRFDPQRFIAPTPRTAQGYGAFLRGEMAEAGKVVLAAEADGEVVGYAYGGLEGQDWMALRGPAGVVYDLVVDPAQRRTGVGRRLLEAAVAALTELGAPRVVLSTAAQNEAAQRLFASAGFGVTMLEMTRERTDPA